jgi:4,5-DOPA dioxygenase extradiol
MFYRIGKHMTGDIVNSLPQTEKFPVLFIGHGSPMNITADNGFTRSLSALGIALPRPGAVMVISAHWLTNGTFVGCGDTNKLNYDFSGFPEELYRILYPAPAAPQYAAAVVDELKSVPVTCNRDWGLDHGAWAVLKHIYPGADIPVFQMSVDYAFGSRSVKPIQYHYDLAEKLQFLRTRGVLILCSGNMVHNLKMLDYSGLEVKNMDWAVELDDRIKRNLAAGRHDDLIHYLSMGRNASMGILSLDHYLPMIYAIGLQQKGEQLKFIYEGIQNGSVSMRSFQIG